MAWKLVSLLIGLSVIWYGRVTCSKPGYEVDVERYEYPICKAYILGDRWALTTKSCVEGLALDSLTLLAGKERFDVTKSVRCDGSSIPLKIPYMDLIMLKVNDSMARYGFAEIAPTLPDEGTMVKALTKHWGVQQVTQYDHCTLKYGFANGVFCIRAKHHLPLSLGLFDRGMLSGIVSKSINTEDTILAMAITYASNWIIDTMCEIIPADSHQY